MLKILITMSTLSELGPGTNGAAVSNCMYI